MKSAIKLTPLQENLVDISLSQPNSGLYLTQVSVSIVTLIQPNSFRKAWLNFCSRTKCLQFSFNEDHFIRHFDPLNLCYRFKDLSTLTTYQKNKALKKLLHDDLNTPILKTGCPPYRTYLIKLAQNRYRMIFTHHHALFDYEGFSDMLKRFFDGYFNKSNTASINSKSRAAISPLPLKIKNDFSSQLEKISSITSISRENPSASAKNTLKDFCTSTHNFNKLTTSKLVSFSKKHHLKLSTIIKFSWAYAIAHTSFQTDINIAYTRQTRTNEKKDIKLSFLTLPINIQLESDVSLLSQLQTFNKKLLLNKKALEHTLDTKTQEKILEKLSCTNILVDYKLSSLTDILSSNFPEKIGAAEFTSKTNYPLALEVFSENKILKLKLSYWECLISKQHVDTLTATFNYFIKHLIKNPQTIFNEVRPQNNLKLPAYKSKATAKIARSNRIISAVNKSITANKDKTAIIFQDRKISYLDLKTNINEAVAHLKTKKIKAGDSAVVKLGRSVDQVVYILALLKLSCTVIPLTAEIPSGRLSEIKRQAKPVLIIQPSKSNTQKPSIKLETYKSQDQKQNKLGSYIIFTSGSTGKPKGVYLTDQSILNTVYNLKDVLPFQKKDCLLAVADPGFDMAIMDYILPLISGATLLIANNEDVYNRSKLIAQINKYKVTTLEATPTFLLNLFSSPKKPHHKLKILAGGESLSKHLAKQLLNYGTLWNLYGPTENSIYSIIGKIPASQDKPFIGKVLPDQSAFIADPFGSPVPTGFTGELYLTGRSLSPGYVLPDLTQKKFTQYLGYSWYKTGDLAHTEKNNIYYNGRIDSQIKNNGFLLHPSEIENALNKFPKTQASVLSIIQIAGKPAIIDAYVKLKTTPKCKIRTKEILLTHLAKHLPHYMLPSNIYFVDNIPALPGGKADIDALRKKNASITPQTQTFTHSNAEKIFEAWKSTLKHDRFNEKTNFFDAGGNSFLAHQLLNKLKKAGFTQLSIIDLYKHPSILDLDKSLSAYNKAEKSTHQRQENTIDEIAITACALRLPKSPNLPSLWNNLLEKKNLTTNFDTDKLTSLSLSIVNSKDFIPSSGIIETPEEMPKGFLNTPMKFNKEQSLFIQLCWEALETAGYTTDKHRIGCFASCNPEPQAIKSKQEHFTEANFSRATGNESLATIAAYALNLNGPAITQNTACSSGLVCLNSAIRSIQNGECDIAIVGSVSLMPNHQPGYFFKENSIFSKNATCSPFDQSANGTLPSSGACVFILQSATIAKQQKRPVEALIIGSHVNNDGAQKVSYAAPSLDGQISCLKEALHEAKLSPNEIDYIETHGTGTIVGDAIELSALNSVYNQRKLPCYIGSIKANLGHTDNTAGLTSLAKAIMVAKTKTIPPQINFSRPSTALQEYSNHFKVSTKTMAIDKKDVYVGISSFGIGGTNAHVIIKRYQPSSSKKHETKKKNYPILLSAHSSQALTEKATQLLEFIQKTRPNINDLSHTLLNGRTHQKYRHLLVSTSTNNLITQLKTQLKKKEIGDNSHAAIEKIKDKKQKYQITDWLNGASINGRKIISGRYIPLNLQNWKVDNQQKNLEKKAVDTNTSNCLKPILEKVNIESFDDFFLDSLTALELSAAIEKQLNVEIKPVRLVNITSLAELAKLISETRRDSSQNEKHYAILKRTEKSALNLFFIHPVGGTSFCYQELASFIKTPSTIYAFHDPDIHSDKIRFHSLKELSSYYVDEILKIQSKGPYFLLGQSLGGVIATEIANTLKRKGHSVNFIGLIESWAKTPKAFQNQELFNSIMQRQHNILLEKLSQTSINKKPWLDLQWLRMKQLYEHPIHKLPFPLYLYKAKDLNQAFYTHNDQLNYWGEFSEYPITRFMCPGNHESILFDENGKLLAKFIDSSLKKVISRE